jgi:hypothetical protein
MGLHCSLRPDNVFYEFSIDGFFFIIKALSYHSEHGPNLSPGYPTIHRFAAGAVKTGVYIHILTRTNVHLISDGWLIKAT